MHSSEEMIPTLTNIQMQHISAQVMHLRFSWSSDNKCKEAKRFTISRSYKSNIDATFDLMTISMSLN